MTPWERAAQEQAAPEQGQKPWEKARQANAGPDRYKGSILPFSVGPDGSARFDSDAGVLGMAKEALGMAKRAVTLPRDALDGKLDFDRGPKHPLEPDPTIERVTEAASVLTPLSPASRAAMRPMTPKEVMKNPPSADDLIATGGRQFDAMRKTGVDYKSASVADLARGVKKSLIDDGILDIADGGAPSTHKILDQLANPPSKSVANIAQLDAARRAANNVATTATSTVERGAARRLERQLSALIERADPKDVVAGSAPEAARLAKSARQNYAAGKRSDTLFGIERNAELASKAANSGQNVGNSTRQRLAALLRDKKVRPGKPITGFTAEETAAIEGVVRGSTPANATRRVGNFLGGGQGLGGGIMTAGGIALGAGAGGAPGAVVGGMIPPIVGGGLKAGSNALTQRALRGVDAMTRRRSPLMNERLANPPMTPVRSGRAAALARALALIEAEERARQQ